MILNPVAVDDTAGGTTVVTASQCSKVRAVVIQNPTGGSNVALKLDGSTDVLTYENGLLLEAGMERVIDCHKGAFTNPVVGICDTGGTATLRVQGIE
jgi:hypothetical protein